MFEPFQDRNPHFFGTVSLSWFVMKSISKTYSFNLFWTKPLRKKVFGQNLDSCKSYFQFLRWNWFFRTNMESNAAVTLHFEDLAVQNYMFLKDMCIHWWKYLIALKGLWMIVKFFFLNILKTTHNSVRESVKNALSRTLLHLVFKIFKNENFTMIKSGIFKQFEIFHQPMHTFFKNL